MAVGRLALDANTIPETQYLDGFSRLRQPWPSGFVCTAVDAESGEFVGWNAESGVDLALAIASGCAVPRTSPPVMIDGRRYIDGGMRSLTNADRSRGHDRVLVVTVLGTDLHESDDARVRFRRIATDHEVQSLRDAGAQVELLVPNAAAAAIGVSLMDASNAPGAGHAGFGQGAAEAERMRAFWG